MVLVLEISVKLQSDTTLLLGVKKKLFDFHDKSTENEQVVLLLYQKFSLSFLRKYPHGLKVPHVDSLLFPSA